MDHESVEEIKRHFDGTVAEVRRHFHVVAEGLRGEFRLLGDSLAANTDRLDRLEGRFDRFETRVAAEFGETRAMIRLSYGELERRIVALEGGG